VGMSSLLDDSSLREDEIVGMSSLLDCSLREEDISGTSSLLDCSLRREEEITGKSWLLLLLAALETRRFLASAPPKMVRARRKVR